jgi:hypothetical protein
MPREIEITPDEVIVRLIGWTAVAALKRELRIPRSAIRSISTDAYRHDGLRLGGTSVPFGEYRQGRFRKDGKRTFLSFEERERTVTLELDRARARWDRVVLGADDPQALAARLAPAA